MRIGTHTDFADACYWAFWDAKAYYYLRISYANHARINRVHQEG